ncbi:MAG: hypothetical protein HC853_18435 [Anaerolineae bacterium]|nr:hypothetical protein [Anaerolineae bacterium]
MTLAPALAGNVGEAEDNPFDPLKTQIDRRYDKTGNRFAIIGGLDASGRIGASFGTDTGAVVKSAQPINNGAWRHVVVSRDSATGLVKVHVDGALSASGAMTTGYLYQRAFGIGRPENGQLANYFPGSLDEVRIYNRQLTDGEVLALYSDLAGEPAAITSGSPTTATYGTPYAYSITTVGSPTPTLTLSGTLPAGISFITNTNGGASVSGTPTVAGSGLVTVTASNGIGSADVREYTWVVSKATLTVTADNKTRVYGVANPALSGTYCCFLNGDTQAVLTGTPTIATTPTATTPAGVYAITVMTGTLSATNYAFTFVNGTLTITGTPPTMTSGAPPAGQYGSAYTFNLSASGDPTPTLSVLGLPSGLSLSNNAITGTPTAAGSFPITITANNGVGTADSDSYTLVIGKAPLTVTAPTYSRNYGMPTPPLQASYSGFVNGDDAGDLGGSTSVTYTPTDTTPAGVYAMVATTGTLSNSNYAYTFVNGTLTINGAPSTYTGGAPPAGTYGSTYYFSMTAMGDPAPSVAVQGLPAG